VIIKDEAMLARFRGCGPCEVCRRVDVRHPHHTWRARGLGGGHRIDHPFNLLACCPGCHDSIHAGRIPKAELMAIIARRERKSVPEIEAELRRLWQAPSPVKARKRVEGRRKT
jgi:hypothetical protein